MSAAPTPETDAAEHELHHTYVGGYMRHCRDGGWVESELARRLERERDEARRELESLRADKARLDWLERYHLSLSRLTTPDMSGIRFIGQCHNPAKERGEAGPSYLRIKGQTIRAAIDAAMQEGTP